MVLIDALVIEDEGLTNAETVDEVSATAANATVDTNLMVRAWKVVSERCKSFAERYIIHRDLKDGMERDTRATSLSPPAFPNPATHYLTEQPGGK